MTNPTAFLFGFLGIFGVSLGLFAVPIFWSEIRSDDRNPKSLRIVLGIILAVFAGFGLGVSVLLAPVIHRSGVEQWSLWASYTALLLGEVMVTSGLGRIRVPLLCCALWALFVIAYRLNV